MTLLFAAPCVVHLQDVPAALNGLLDSLPAKVSVQGLPFDVVFTYAVYTLNYVVVKVASSPVLMLQHCWYLVSPSAALL